MENENSLLRENCESSDVEEDEEEHHTSFPTRLREFEEKNDLMFHHLLGARNDMRRHSCGADGLNHNCSGDQYSRHSPICDVVDEDKDLFGAIEMVFNKLCVEKQEAVDSHHNETARKSHKIASKHLISILSKIGQEYDTSELNGYMKHNIDKEGLMDFNGYQRILVHFLKDPNAIDLIKTKYNKLF